MAKQNVLLQHFAVGVIDASVLPRIDLGYVRLAAEDQTNILALTSGKGFVRPGLGYITSTLSNAAARIRRFAFSETQAALMEFSDLKLRVVIDDVALTRPSVSTTISNGSFATSASWTDASTGGGTLTFGGSGLILNAVNRGGLAKCTRTITVSAPNQNIEHGLKIIVARGPVTFRCGSAAAGDEYIAETNLQTGEHSLAFTPTGDFYLQFQSDLDINRIVTSIAVEAAGVVQLTTPWPAASLKKIRLAQSADVVFAACTGYQQYRIERRGTGVSLGRSWSVVKYYVNDGPFYAIRSSKVKLKVAAVHGNTTMTADQAFFKSTHVGGIFRLFHKGRAQASLLGAEDNYTEVIRVNGIGTDNDFSVTRSGTWVGTLTVQRSYDGPDEGFIDTSTTYTTNATTAFTPGAALDNIIQWYRVGFKPGDYTSGAANVTMTYKGDGDFGIARVIAFNSATSVDVEVLSPFADVTYTDDWREGMWSDRQGWPSAVGFYDGRLWWGGDDRIWGSVSDAYDAFDEETEGDSGPINRPIATGGGISAVKWILPLQRLIFGTEGSETSARSSSLDEPISPTNLTLRDASSIGSTDVDPAKLDSRGLFVDGSSKRLYEMTFDSQSYDYHSTPLSRLVAGWFEGGVREIAVQRRPDTRIWMVMEDGTAMCLIYDADQGPDPGQPMAAFIPIVTDGTFESVAVLPGSGQDLVYFVVNRTINGSTKRYIEKMALDSETTPDTLCKCMDCFSVITQASSTTVTVGSQLEGESVVAWAGGVAYPGPYTVTGGAITLPTAVTSVVVGVPFDWKYKSSRLAYAAQAGTAMLMQKKVDHLGLILTNFHRDGLKYGRSFAAADLYSLPKHDNSGRPKDTIVLDTICDEEPVEFDGGWSTDSRVHIKGSSPYPAHLLGLVITMTTNDRI